MQKTTAPVRINASLVIWDKIPEPLAKKNRKTITLR